MAYKTPVDIPQLPAAWTDWPLADRVTAAAKLPVPYWARLAAVAITLNEQPGKIPNGNCCGLMSFGTKMPWGWREKQWANVKPTGYALLKEGQTGLLAPFLAFASPADSLRFLAERCEARGIYDGKTYARLWVGQNPVVPETAAAFDRCVDKVLAELWRRAGA